ncbi:MAG: Gfo/Idh/MocA family oxidoreductase [Desulfofustis sp.]|nr:Gfo/Idh/MocA family oxidoreductase [Desulfofustis sp.]NNK56926.1 Gfo/Idh/MocA family oxidoreductase [Desulfofustis sp.]
MEPVRLGLIGGGLISAKHIEGSKNITDGSLVALCDVNPECQSLAEELKIPFFTDHRRMIDEANLEGVIDGTPNQFHAEIGIYCAGKGIHVLTEKPIAATLEEGKRMVEAVEESGISMLVGHHRRYYPPIRRAREIVQSGELGQLVGVSMLWALMKPDVYFEVAWRSQKGGGPILINIIHEMDNLRFICGDVAEINANARRLVRSGEVEDTVSMRFELVGGALGTALVTDTAPSPWSYELTSGENSDYFKTDQDCYHFLGTKGSLSFPTMEVWSHPHDREKGWWEPLMRRSEQIGYSAPFTAQLEHFCKVIRGDDKPVITAADGLMTLATTLAVLESAETGRAVAPQELLEKA